MWLPPVIGGVLAIIFLLLALRANKRQRLVDNLPTSKTTGVFIGLVEVKGTAECAEPLISFLAERRCVQYSYSVEEHWSRTVVETYTDDKGNTRTRTRHESGWKSVASGDEMTPFYLKDDYGHLLIQPEGATLEPQSVFSVTCGPEDPLYYAKGPGWAVADSDHRRRFTEQAMELHVPLYILGQARERKDMVAAEIAADKNAPLYLISTRSEKEISRSFGWAFWGWHFLGLLLAVSGVFFQQARGAANGIAPGWLVLAGTLYILTASVGWVWMAYNSLVDLRQRVRQAWSLVEVQLKRRHDLIPNLVTTVTGLRDYENTLQTEVAALRNQLTATAPGVAGPDFSAVGKVMLAVAERYPELKAQPSFLNLQQNLADTETRIALARSYYNEIATQHNVRLEIIPDRFLAGLAKMQPQPLMAANDFERASVVVKFAE